MINIKIPQSKNQKNIENFFIKKKLGFLVDLSKKKKRSVNEMIVNEPYIPELNDLYRLYQFILINKRTTILEFGSGWSSLIFCLALKELKDRCSKEIKYLRRNNPFELFVLENEKKYLNISKNRIRKFFIQQKFKSNLKIHYCFSEVEMTLFNDLICTQYKKMPLCNPDFIYLDGPDQFEIFGKINNLTISNYEFMPMSSDILKYENFLTPGTIIVVDGRTANARFLKNNFQRKWNYYYDFKNDQSFFYLKEKALGRLNQIQLDFYKK